MPVVIALRRLGTGLQVGESLGYITSYTPFWAVKNDPVSTKNTTGQDGLHQ